MPNTNERDALMLLVEQYAEARHKHGGPEYNHISNAARNAVIDALAATAPNAGAPLAELPARIVDRLLSSDPDFDDCTNAANLIRKQATAVEMLHVAICQVVPILNAAVNPFRVVDANNILRQVLVDYADLELAASAPAQQAGAPLPLAPSDAEGFDDYPDFNPAAMGCGLEDRGITDRYEAMRYGWEQAIEGVEERIDIFLEGISIPPQATLPASEPDAYLLTRGSGFQWSAVPRELGKETREFLAADDVRIDPLYTRAQPQADAAEPVAMTEDWWYDLAARHATKDWNGAGYLNTVKALVNDALGAQPPAPGARGGE